MNSKEQLREKFSQILAHDVGADFDSLLDYLMEAVDEVFSKPLVITIKPTDEQLEALREAFRSDTAALIYGDPGNVQQTTL